MGPLRNVSLGLIFGLCVCVQALLLFGFWMERRHTAWFNTHPFTGGLFSNEAGFFIETIIAIIILDAALERRRRERWNYVHDKHIQHLCSDLSDAISNIVNSYGQSYFDLYLQAVKGEPEIAPGGGFIRWRPTAEGLVVIRGTTSLVKSWSTTLKPVQDWVTECAFDEKWLSRKAVLAEPPLAAIRQVLDILSILGQHDISKGWVLLQRVIERHLPRLIDITDDTVIAGQTAIVESTAEYWAEVAEVSGAKSSAPGSRICKAADNIATLKQLLNKVENNNSRNTRRLMKSSEVVRLEKALHNYAIQVDILHTLLFSLGNLYEALGKRMARSERNWRKAVEHAESAPPTLSDV